MLVAVRDLKPANLMIGGSYIESDIQRRIMLLELGTVKIADFGACCAGLWGFVAALPGAGVLNKRIAWCRLLLHAVWGLLHVRHVRAVLDGLLLHGGKPLLLLYWVGPCLTALSGPKPGS